MLMCTVFVLKIHIIYYNMYSVCMFIYLCVYIICIHVCMNVYIVCTCVLISFLQGSMVELHTIWCSISAYVRAL